MSKYKLELDTELTGDWRRAHDLFYPEAVYESTFYWFDGREPIETYIEKCWWIKV